MSAKSQSCGVKSTLVTELTQILQAVERGEENSSERLLPLVYDELRWLAADNWGASTISAPVSIGVTNGNGISHRH